MNRNSYTVRAFDVTSVTAFLAGEFESGFFQPAGDSRDRSGLSGMGRQFHSKIQSFFCLPLLGNRFAFFAKAIEMKPKHLFEVIQRRGQILTVVGDS